MAKLAIDRASIVFGKKNREIFIPNREIGRFSLYYLKSGDLPKNRETWQLCILSLPNKTVSKRRCFSFNASVTLA